MLSGLFRCVAGRVNGGKGTEPSCLADGHGRGSGDCKSDRILAPLNAEGEIGTDGENMVTEATSCNVLYQNIPMINGRPDRRKMIARSTIWIGGCSLKDMKRLRRFILRRCSDGGQLTHDQFMRFYSVLDLLWTTGFLAMRFHTTKDETLRITEKGKKYLAWLDKELGAEIDCRIDGEPILRTRMLSDPEEEQ